MSFQICGAVVRWNVNLVFRRICPNIGQKFVRSQCKPIFVRLAPVFLAGGYTVYLSTRVAQAKGKTSTAHYSVTLDRAQSQNAHHKQPELKWSHLWYLLKPFAAWLVAAVAVGSLWLTAHCKTAILTAVVNIRMPLALGQLINEIARVQSAGPAALTQVAQAAKPVLSLYFVQVVWVIWKCFGFLGCVYSADRKAGLTALYIGFVSALGERVAHALRCKLFGALLRQDMAFFDAQRTGELVTRVGADVQEFKSALKACISQGLRTATQIGGSAVSLYLISPSMTVATVTGLPILIAFGTFAGALLRLLARKAHGQSAKCNAVADECFGNVRTVRAFAMEPVEMSAYEFESDRARGQHEQLGLGIGLFQAGANLTLNGLVLCVLWGGARLISAERMSPGELTAFLVTAQTIQRSMQQLSALFGQAVKGFAAGARIFEFIDYTPTLWVPEGTGKTIPYHSLIGDIRFSNVTFAYPTRPEHNVLEQMGLHVPNGKVVALCGVSGSGKSTIVSLLERFYSPQSGHISIDNVDISRLDQHWLRRSLIGYISQEPVLFNTTIGQNIAYGKPGATQEEIISAAKSAHANKFINDLPSGYDTMVGERGCKLSGGQRQRIAIARALIKQPAVLILDEATSALDSDSERHVQEALAEATRGRTVLVIAHRLSTIRNADLIAVVADKKILEVGSHDELMRKRGAYFKLIQRQEQGELDDLLA